MVHSGKITISGDKVSELFSESIEWALRSHWSLMLGRHSSPPLRARRQKPQWNMGDSLEYNDRLHLKLIILCYGQPIQRVLCGYFAVLSAITDIWLGREPQKRPGKDLITEPNKMIHFVVTNIFKRQKKKQWTIHHLKWVDISEGCN